jgi:hypothetical protein
MKQSSSGMDCVENPNPNPNHEIQNDVCRYKRVTALLVLGSPDPLSELGHALSCSVGGQLWWWWWWGLVVGGGWMERFKEGWWFSVAGQLYGFGAASFGEPW